MANKEPERGIFSSGELAEQTGVSSDTLRHYERMGVLPKPRRARNGYREYPIEALDRVKLIRSALAVGFTLTELAGILRVRDAGGVPCHEVRSLAIEKLSDVELRLQNLTAMRNELRQALKQWDKRLSETESGTRARLLESLAPPGASKPLMPQDHFENIKKRRSRT